MVSTLYYLRCLIYTNQPQRWNQWRVKWITLALISVAAVEEQADELSLREVGALEAGEMVGH